MAVVRAVYYPLSAAGVLAPIASPTPLRKKLIKTRLDHPLRLMRHLPSSRGRGAANEGEVCVEDWQVAPEQPEPACGPDSKSSIRPRSSVRHPFKLTMARQRSGLSSADRVHLGNIGWYYSQKASHTHRQHQRDRP